MTKLERDRPVEWLRGLAEQPDAYRLLLESSGGLARAAYRVASARCRVHSGVGATPTLRELEAASISVARHSDSPGPLPPASILASECEERGLPVIRPLPGSAPSHEPPSAPKLRRAS